MHIQICTAFDSQCVFVVTYVYHLTLLDVAPFLYAPYKMAKPQKKVEALGTKTKLLVSRGMHAREKTRTG